MRIEVLAIKRGMWLGVVLLLYGCSSTLPTGRYQTFRTATDGIYSSASDTYGRIEARQRDFVVQSAPDKPLTTDTFKPVINGQSFDITDALNKRAAALDVLASYGKALEAIAGKDATSDVDNAVQNLSGSLQGLDGGADSALTNAFSTILDGAARGLTNSIRKDTLSKAMTSAQPGVEKLSELIQKDNQRIALFVQLMRDAYLRHANVARPAYGTLDRYSSDLKSAETLDEFSQIQELLAASSKAISKLPSAHRELLESLDDKPGRMKALSEMVAEAKRLNGFYKSLPAQ